LAQGDRVGLGIIAARVLAWSPPDRGPGHGAELLNLLAHVSSTIDADRCDLDEADVAARVLEHMRSLDPTAARRVRAVDLDRLARRAERVRTRAPLASSEPYSHSPRERALRRYLEAFGVYCPPRLEPERPRTDAQLAAALQRLCRERPRPSVVYVWSAPADPASRPEIERALLRHPRRRIDLRWVAMSHERSIPQHGTPLAAAVGYAVCLRARAAQERGERALRRIGIRTEQVRPRVLPWSHLDAPAAQPRDALPGD
jgi:uncharacterized protein (DUF58 family)